MLSRYTPHFDQMSPEQAEYVAGRLQHRHMFPADTQVESGTRLYNLCDYHGLDQADVVMSMASDGSAMACNCIEVLIGRPIVRETPEQRAKKPRSRGAAVRRVDHRTILTVEPNPKRPGSAAHARYSAYQVGITVQAAIEAGATPADIRHDLGRGFITVGDKR